MKFIAEVLCALTLLGIVGIAFVYSGWFDVAASSSHSKIEQWVFNKTMKQSVVAQAAGIANPPTFTDEMVRDGFEHYDEMCTVCHAGPGLDQSEISKGLNPPAPNLSKAVKVGAHDSCSGSSSMG